jgi:hypothetical protein
MNCFSSEKEGLLSEKSCLSPFISGELEFYYTLYKGEMVWMQ